MRKIKTLSLALAILLLGSSAGYAQDVFATVIKKGTTLFMAVRDVIFVVGGFGLVGLAIGAIFGRVNWKWFSALAIGLIIVAAAGAVVNYFTSESGTGASSSYNTDLGDTLK
jgi:type IV secretory pathway VirB2 component (pilin)